MKILHIVIIIFFSQNCFGQLSKSETVKLLTNGNSRQWEFDGKYIKTLGGCEGTWCVINLDTSGKANLICCKNGNRITQDLTWGIKPVGNHENNEWQIEFKNAMNLNNVVAVKIARLDLPLTLVNKKGQKMIWRDVPSCKKCFGRIIEFKSLN